MKLPHFFCCALIFILIVGCETTTDEASDHSSRMLLIDGEPFFIKGVCYHPVPVGSRARTFDRLEEDLDLMKAAGINTVRVYEPIKDRKILDQFLEAGVKLIISFGYNQNGDYDILSGSFVDYIVKFKDHEAILFWELGNEYNYHPEWFDGDLQNWYNSLNASAALAKKADPRRLVATSHGDLPDQQALESCPNVDVWGMNVYRWDDPEAIFSEWAAISDKPMYLSEAGSDSYMATAEFGYEAGKNEKAQADAVRNILSDIYRFKDICSGVTVFAFVDEWWKDSEGSLDQQDVGGKPPPAGFPFDAVANEEYWGVVQIDRTPKEAYRVLQDFFLEDPDAK